MIYPEETTGGLRELLIDTGDELNELEAASIIFTDPVLVSGVALDKIGELLGMRRSGMSDVDYSMLLKQRSVATAIDITIEDYIERIKSKVQSVYLEKLTDPSASPPRFRWDGRHKLSGLDCMDPDQRNQSIKLIMEIGAAASPQGIVDILNSTRIRGSLVFCYFISNLISLDFGLDYPYVGSPVDGVAVYDSSGVKVAEFPVAASAGSITFEITEVTAAEFQTVKLKVGAVEIGAFVMPDQLSLSFNVDIKFMIGGF